MKLWLIAVGLRQPAWAEVAYGDFAKRFPPEMPLVLKAVKADPRVGKSTHQYLEAEAARLLAHVPKGARKVILDERGTSYTTSGLGERLSYWMRDGRDVALIIGGPDGLSPELKAGADEAMRLSDLTLPHAMARIILVESLYRAWTLLKNHPYHRE